MNNINQILTYFEKELISILDSKEEHVKSIKDTLRKIKNKDQVISEEVVEIYDKGATLQTGINIIIDDYNLAEDVHEAIRKLIATKKYPIEEKEFFHFIGTNKWHFKFNY